MKKLVNLLESFENNLEIGWDYAIDTLYNGISKCVSSYYTYLIESIIHIYYQAYNFYDIDITEYDDGLVYEIRNNQVNLLLLILKNIEK